MVLRRNFKEREAGEVVLIENQEINLLPLRLQLAGHFIGEQAAEAKAARLIWPLLLNGPQRLDVSCCPVPLR